MIRRRDQLVPLWPVPPNWKWASVSDIAGVGLGRQRSPENHTGENMRPYVRAGNITWNGWDLADVKEMNFDDADFERFRLCPGDVLVNEGSGSANEVGKPAIWQGQIENCCFQNTLIRVKPEGCMSEYIRSYFLLSALTENFVSETQGINIHHIGKEGLACFPVPVCPHSEQHRIVTKIDSLSAKSRRAQEHLDHIPQLVERYKQAVLAAAFRGDLTNEWRKSNPTEAWSQSQFRELEKRRKAYLQDRRGSRLRLLAGSRAIPKGWFQSYLSDVGSLQVGYAYKSKWYSKHGTPLLRGANIAPGTVIWDDIVRLPSERVEDFSKYSLNTGDIVIAMDRPIISSGLKVARIRPSDAGCLLVQRVARYVPSEFVENDFAWHLINSQIFIDHAVTQATGSDLPHISSNDILTTPLPLPILTEQREIVRRIEKAFIWIDRLASETTKARKLIDHLDQAILAKAFRGEIVPQDPNDEPASVLLERIKAERLSNAAASTERKKAAPARSKLASSRERKSTASPKRSAAKRRARTR
jgi:type I restriction enzyme S subunit